MDRKSGSPHPVADGHTILNMAQDSSTGHRARKARGAAIGQTASREPYMTWPAMLNMGRYILTTKPPTTTPRKTIMIGSIKVVRLSTATSTSSS